ncbi:hypothetical protein LTR10_021639 [Elasticomyces elasticus]|uniref:Rrn9 domain-containing protein n=1 Tax=Exophiala sideris TaxID=1016849 RepID=A0ABR0J282_9EURO|nr:hypothetical protein LTR10_021639 [Elasticomyces elasticus]KAK5024117.1 hypothetical protein LTS07_008852 [Exophiala sideris]KAK5029023.1 hypothetical protein LTR13_008893 [Exophiala sideris]KAK5054829.1 hypothetical protein LTR69_008737 [Exophiala sideris]KAK5178846.1 hypothetical protein LTR44_008674 [Eurotiomycetes sp. CCFEE 6388]
MDSESSHVQEVDDDDIASPTSADFRSSPQRQLTDELRNGLQSPTLSVTEKIIPSVVDQPFAQGENAETYFTRPNRYFGPASTWKSWTEEERTTAQSLDRTRSQDLGIHLINTSALKKKSRASRAEGKWKRVRKGKQRAASVLSTTGDDLEEEASSGGDAFSIPKYWAAWPMPPGEVPRQELLPRTGTRQGVRLADIPRPSASLEDCIVATATKIARDTWNARHWEARSPVPFERDMKVDHGPSKIEIDDAEDDSLEESDQEESGSESEDPDFPVFSSRPFPPSESVGTQEDAENNTGSEDDSATLERRPVPLADDEEAKRLFLPSARHVLSKVDDLLLGLHHARYSHTLKGQSGDNETERTSSLPASRSRRRATSADTAISTVSSVATTSSKGSRRAQNLELRDWSDVVGMASLTGWDSEVVARASERCAQLFGENMLFRNFHEGAPTEGNESFFTEHLAFSTEGSEEPVEQEQEQVGLRTCPHESCPRHTLPFRKQWRLQRHLAEVHRPGRTDAQLRKPRLVQSRSTSLDVSDVDVDMLAPPDAILCPMKSCQRAKKPFSTGRALYDHVRRIHPHVDVQKVKRLELSRRRERRGRPTNQRRLRRASQGRSSSRITLSTSTSDAS